MVETGAECGPNTLANMLHVLVPVRPAVVPFVAVVVDPLVALVAGVGLRDMHGCLGAST